MNFRREKKIAAFGMSDVAGRSRREIESIKGAADQELVRPREILDESSDPFPSTLVLAPLSRRPTTLPEATVRSVLSADPGRIQLARYDVICFPGIDRDSDSKPPQRIMAQFAHHGHRVFHLRPDAFLPPGSSEAFHTRAVAPNLFETRVAVARQTNGYGEVIDPEDATLLKALAALRSAYGIDGAVAYVQLPFWSSVAMRTRERWGWKVVYDRTDIKENFSLIDQPLAERQGALEERTDVVVKMGVALQERASEDDERCVAQSRQYTRTEHWQLIDGSIRAAFERISVVIVTFNNLVFNKLCLGSILANTEYPNYEVIVVDNGSTDGTPAYLRSLTHQHVRTVLNADNLGFARANNQGLAMATGDVLVLLNNDTLVPQGWLTRLVRHLEDPGIGLVGPVTNRIGNEAQIEVPYRTYGEFVRFAREYTRAHEGELFDIRMLAMFCLAMRRDVYERLGPLDERFEVGMLEDDDYAMQARVAGYRVVCAEDVFVHHFGEASFGKLVPTGEYGELLRANRHRFEEKWGIRWEPYGRRPSERYQLLVGRVREVVRNALPPWATVIVVSKGDDELLELNGRQAWHFPQIGDGLYAGYHPVDSAQAIAHLEELRAKGGDYLLFPSSAFWWLEHYRKFDQYLKSRYRVALHEEETCMIFALREAETERRDTVMQDNRAGGGY